MAFGEIGGDFDDGDLDVGATVIMPEGMDECYWRALSDLASPSDTAIISSFYSAKTDEIAFPAPPIILANPALIGMDERANAPKIMPEIARLRGVAAGAGEAAQSDYYTKVSVLDTDRAKAEADRAKAKAEADAAMSDADRARAEADAAINKADASGELVQDLNNLLNN